MYGIFEMYTKKILFQMKYLYKQMNVNNYTLRNIDDNQWLLKPTPVDVENYTWKCWLCLHVPMGET